MQRRRDGLYRRDYGIFCFRYKDKHGQWREKSTGETVRAEALHMKKDWDKDNDNGELPTHKREWTVAQVCTLWVEHHAAHLRSQKAQRNEQSYLRQLLRHFPGKKLKAVTLDDLRDYQKRRAEAVRQRPINIELGILVRVLRENNLWRGDLRSYERLSEPESDVGSAVSEEQLMRLESVARTEDAWEVAYCSELLAANTGVRGGEIKKLRMGKINLEARSIQIARESTKSDRGARQVELNQPAMAAIARLYQRAQLLGANEPEHFLLPADLSRHTKDGDPLKGRRGFDPTLHQTSWNTAWRNLRKAAGLGKLRFHDLRHTFISRMAELGVPLQVTQATVGHMSDAITRHYTHISNSVARDAVEKLEQIRNAPRFVDVLVDEPDVRRANRLN
jgi:integrase